MRRYAIAAATCAFAFLASGNATRSDERPWLFFSDVHYDTYLKHDARYDVDGDRDTNAALLDSFLREAQRTNRDPPVVVIAGDFIAHHADRNASAKTIAYLARRFDAAFPRAQFLFTLGNNDSSCGDYAPTIDSAFLRDVARAWEPLVNRRGASPDFAKTFAYDGSYVAKLPEAGLRAVVIDDNAFALRYSGKCVGSDEPARRLAALRAVLQTPTAAKQHNIVLFHVPPGIDAYSTAQIAHRLFVVPFMRPHERDALIDILGAPASRVALVLAGHTHKFAFRVLPQRRGAGIPLLLVPSVSPVFGNHPSYLTANVSADGTLENVTQYAFDGTAWSQLDTLAAVGVQRLTAPALRKLQRDLLAGSPEREIFARAYEGGATSEIDAKSWPVYACAATIFNDSAFEDCIGRHGVSFVTQRGIVAGSGVAVAVAIGMVVFLALRRRRRAASPESP